jgi:hypothetical protein
MAAEKVLVITLIVVFLAGMVAGGVLLVSIASRSEDRRRLSREAPTRFTQAGRWVTGLRVGGPDSYRGRRLGPAEAEPELAEAYDPNRDPRVP